MAQQFITLEVYSELVLRVVALENQIEEMKTKTRGGPKSDKPMTDQDAFRCKFGDLAKASHKDAAAQLGLSYGQIFSCRGSYTFKHVRDTWKSSEPVSTVVVEPDVEIIMNPTPVPENAPRKKAKK